MNSTGSASEDTSTLLGMRSKAAWVIAGAFLLADLASRLAFASGAVAMLVNLLAFTIITAAVAAELLVRGDPLPIRVAIPVAAATPMASALELAVMSIPLEHPSQVHLGAGAAIGGFLCARGRVGIASAGFLAMVLVFVAWADSIGLGPVYALGFALPNLAVLLMAAAFARRCVPWVRKSSASTPPSPGFEQSRGRTWHTTNAARGSSN